MTRPHVVIGTEVISRLVRFCADTGRQRLVVVADGNTWPVLGKAVEASLRAGGFQIRSVVLTGGEVVADADHILQVLLASGEGGADFVGVGSGTITDITRFVSHRTGGSFIVMPTAPSVDGFTSLGSPLIVHGVKTTALAHPPVAIFADLAVLSSAPRSMIAAGFGDMLGKHTSVADWRLGRLLWDLPYDAAIAERCLAAVRRCEEAASEIASGSQAGVRSLLESLLESGFCMLDFGNSLPASGAEHHFSHFWEMKLLREGKPGILHGAKVGVATIFIAALYEEIRSISRDALAVRLEQSRLPLKAEEIRRVREAYGPAADDVVAGQAGFIEMDETTYGQLKQKIMDGWDEIRDTAAHVPASARIAEMLRCVGGPSTMRDLGLPESDLDLAAGSALYLRNHFTVCRLARIVLQPERRFSARGVVF